jgi:hypothetical protein
MIQMRWSLLTLCFRQTGKSRAFSRLLRRRRCDPLVGVVGTCVGELGLGIGDRDI